MDELQKALKKSLWKNGNRQTWSYFCPLCKSERALPHPPNPNSRRAVVQVALTTAFFTLVTYSWLGFKGLVAAVPFWVIYETLFRARVRAKLACTNCGFDPFLAIQDVKRAKAEVETHWRKKFEEKGIPYPEKGRKPQNPAQEAENTSSAPVGPGSENTQ